ncbi:hypothetical protein [Nocardia sp. NPDC057440]|uniref:hypothetical protein n=1 Tax=Nocardia sp. NPDC057440 TaxID=3346134 RepID=UPI003672BF0E
MAYTLTEIRTALASTIETHTSASVYTYAEVQAKGNYPAVIIEPHATDFERAMNRGVDEWDFNIFVLVRSADDASAQQELDGFVTGEGDDSIRQVLFEHRELGLDDSVDAHVYSMRGYGGGFEWGGTKHMGAILKARVFVSN